jgi:hypothetical protein
MSNEGPLVRLYELSGEPPGSPYCWLIRFALNLKGIPYTVTKLSFPAIKPTCEKFFPGMEGISATVPIIELLGLKSKF